MKDPNIEVKKCAICLDNWKQKIFENRLKKEGYSFKRKGHLTPDTMVLQVKVPAYQLNYFAGVVKEMEEEARQWRLSQLQ
jgi:hypothetical protein